MKTKKIIFILAFVIGILITFNLFQKSQPVIKVISALPSDNVVDVDFNISPQVHFDRPPENISFLSEPTIDFATQVENNLISLILNQPLAANTDYRIVVLAGKKEIFSWSFTTRAQTESEAIIEEMETDQQDYPLAALLPYKTKNFEISYEGPLLLRVVLKNANQKKQALDWIQSKEVDPNTHQIEWVN